MRKDLEREASPAQKSAPDNSVPDRVSRGRSDSVCEDEPPTKRPKDSADDDGWNSPSEEVLVTPDLPLPFLRDEVKKSDSSSAQSSEAGDSQSKDSRSSETR